MKKVPAIFEGHEIRRVYDEKTETWFFSVVDIIRVLTQQPDHRKAQSYWTTLKNRLKEEGNQVVTNCDQLKLPAADGKNYLTDVAHAETLLRLVQSVPSPKAEPINLKAGLGFLTQRRKGAEDAELRSHGGPENVHLLGAPVEQQLSFHSSALSAALRLCVFHPIAVSRLIITSRPTMPQTQREREI